MMLTRSAFAGSEMSHRRPDFRVLILMIGDVLAGGPGTALGEPENVTLTPSDALTAGYDSRMSVAVENDRLSGMAFCDGEPNGGNLDMTGRQGNVSLDPLFACADGPDGVLEMQDDNLRVLSDSLVINAGDADFVSEPGETDRDGHTRILCGRVDMGAYAKRLILTPSLSLELCVQTKDLGLQIGNVQANPIQTLEKLTCR